MLVALLSTSRAPDKALPTPHHQFSTHLETTAHQLNATSDYPPYKRYMSVHYDYSSRRARIDYQPVPHMPPKSYVRRYDLGHEWMVTEIRSTKECQKSRLREAMPVPAFPKRFIYVGQARVRGMLCDHWREDLGEETVEYFEAADTGVPVRLTTEAVESVSPVRVTIPLMTYDFYRFEPGPQPEEFFRMRASSQSSVFGTDTELTIGECDRVVQDMGFPYVSCNSSHPSSIRPVPISRPSRAHVRAADPFLPHVLLRMTVHRYRLFACHVVCAVWGVCVAYVRMCPVC